VRQTVHYLEDVGEISCVETPCSKGYRSIFWNIEITMVESGLTWKRSRIYETELDDILIDMLAKAMRGQLEDFKIYEFWQNQ